MIQVELHFNAVANHGNGSLDIEDIKYILFGRYSIHHESAVERFVNSFTDCSSSEEEKEGLFTEETTPRNFPIDCISRNQCCWIPQCLLFVQVITYLYAGNSLPLCR